jgi:hypothetical protein
MIDYRLSVDALELLQYVWPQLFAMSFNLSSAVFLICQIPSPVKSIIFPISVGNKGKSPLKPTVIPQI